MARRHILIGIVIGQLLSLPVIAYLYFTPRIVAMTISDIFYNHNETRYLEIKDIPEGNILSIYIASEDRVNEVYQGLYPGDDTKVEGFYDDRTNTIWCVYDPLVLYHEIRHVTEGGYHR